MQKDNTKLSMIKNIIHLYTMEWFVVDAYFIDNMGHLYPLADLYHNKFVTKLWIDMKCEKNQTK